MSDGDWLQLVLRQRARLFQQLEGLGHISSVALPMNLPLADGPGGSPGSHSSRDRGAEFKLHLRVFRLIRGALISLKDFEELVGPTGTTCTK